MSMQMLTILQIAYLTVAYLGVMVFIPAAVFYPFFEEKPLPVRFLAYLSIGNIYVINLVFLLQFLHISNRITLILGILIPACAAIGVLHWNSWTKNALTYAGETTYGVMLRTVGMRLILTRMFQALFSTLWKKLKDLFQVIFKHPVDILGTILVLALAFMQYGSNTLTNFGYMASDTPVHNYWINSLFDNKPFVAGVYPHGMHVIVYFLSEVFSIDVYILLRIFCVLQDVMMHVSLLIFLRQICKSVFAPYAALIVYLEVMILHPNSILRLFNSLPQEYGMIFILPSITFLFRFFESRKAEKGSKGWKLESTKELALFAINFALTLSVHFYNTMVAGLLCVATAIGFIVYIFRKSFFWRIMLFGILSILVAAWPMVFAYATGTKLEGSLRWGLSIMQASQSAAPTQSTPLQSSSGGTSLGIGRRTVSAASTQGDNVLLYRAAASTQGDNVLLARAAASTQGKSVLLSVSAASTQGDKVSLQSVQGAAQAGAETASQIAVEKKSPVDRIKEKGQKIYKAMKSAETVYVFKYLGEKAPGTQLLMVLVLFVCGVFCFVIGERQYGCMAVSVAVGNFLLSCVMISQVLGIPSLMDQSRCSTYLAYVYAASLGVCLDCLLFILFGWLPGVLIKNFLAFACAGFLVFFLVNEFGVREVYYQTTLEKNGAIICVTNILRENRPRTYTIVSANDELRMIEKKGYFYEIIDLLRKNEGANMAGFLEIPTPKIYIFIEKIPGSYGEGSAYAGQAVSRDSAANRLPYAAGIGSYKGTNRHIVMSKMYYWAQTLQNMYPNEMSVYYEDEEFICYELDQNVYRPFDLSFDYGYNYAGLARPEDDA